VNDPTYPKIKGIDKGTEETLKKSVKGIPAVEPIKTFRLAGNALLLDFPGPGIHEANIQQFLS